MAFPPWADLSGGVVIRVKQLLTRRYMDFGYFKTILYSLDTGMKAVHDSHAFSCTLCYMIFMSALLVTTNS